MIKEKLQISREKVEFIYSVFLLIIIPALLVANTFVLNSSFSEDFDDEIRKKANSINQVTAIAATNSLDDVDSIQVLVDDVKATNESVIRSEVYQETEDTITVIASSDEERIGEEVEDFQTSNVKVRKRAINRKVFSPTDESLRAWRAIEPILDNDSNVVAYVVTDVSLLAADTIVSENYRKSIFLLVGSITVIALLLFNHFKFVQYAVLFRKLKEVDQLKNDFLNVATHELKAPMTIIKGHVSMLLENSDDLSDKMKQQLNEIKHSTEQLTTMVSDLLDVSRIESGRIKYDLEAVDLHVVIKKIVEEYRPHAERKGVKIIYKDAEKAAMAISDKGKTKEIFTNLIDNAVKYTNDGQIVITHKVRENVIVTSVKDSGIGMSSIERQKLFQRFYRVKNKDTASIRGTGLGLWIIKQYIEQMDGTIYVDSIKNVGTEFTVELPRKNTKVN